MGRTLTETDVLNFVGVSLFAEPLFLDEEYCRQHTPYGRRIVPASLTFAAAEGLVAMTGDIHHTGLAFLGMELKVEKPVFPGDTIRIEVEVTAKRPTKRPDRGIVTTKNSVLNQNGEVVLVYTPTRMVRTRAGE